MRTRPRSSKPIAPWRVSITPDLHPGDTAAEDRVKAINEAYQALGDPERRHTYDARGQGNPPTPTSSPQRTIQITAQPLE